MKIIIDPGHGGSDPGAVANGLAEKELTLTIAKQMAVLLKEYKHLDIKLTREEDRYIELGDRAKLANEWGADYFISIHINAGGGTGFESFIHPARNKRSVALQHTIHAEIVRALGAEIRDRGMKDSNFAVLRQTNMPALLTESLFIDHPNDAKRLKDEAFVRLLASAHVQGILQAFPHENPQPLAPTENRTAQGTMYRVIVDDKQIGAFTEYRNIVSQIEQQLGQAERIVIEKRR